jgi:hypothetical protein
MRSCTKSAEVELGVNAELAVFYEDVVNEGVGGGEEFERLKPEPQMGIDGFDQGWDTVEQPLGCAPAPCRE